MKHPWLLVVGLGVLLIGLLGVAAIVLGGGRQPMQAPYLDEDARQDRQNRFDRDGTQDDGFPRGPGDGRRGQRRTPFPQTPDGDQTPGPFDLRPDGDADAGSLGELVYRYGYGEDEEPIPASGGPVWFQRMGGGCAACHGIDGMGSQIGMMGQYVESPEITWEELNEDHGYSPDEIVTMVREGVEPDGDQLNEWMPRWDLSEAEADALIDHLRSEL